MREESHLEDMRSAIRGDFERLAERRGGQELLRSTENVTEQAQEPEQALQAAEPAVDEAEVPSQPTPHEAAPTDSGPAEEPPDAEREEPEPRSFFDRLLGR